MAEKRQVSPQKSGVHADAPRISTPFVFCPYVASRRASRDFIRMKKGDIYECLSPPKLTQQRMRFMVAVRETSFPAEREP